MTSTTEQKVNRIIARKGGTRLDNEWTTCGGIIHVQCAHGHDWKVRASSLLYSDSWCRACYNETRRLGISEARSFAKKNGGRCLSRRYVSTHSALKWACKHGHHFERPMHSVKDGLWCTECPQPERNPDTAIGMAAAVELATSAGGALLGECSNSNTQAKWKCSEGHEFTSSGKAVLRRGYFCPECEGRRPLTLAAVQTICAKRGGRCLSLEFKNVLTPMDFECADGHRWTTQWRNIGYHDSWCPTCSRTRGGMERLLGIAAQHGGECLSDVYRGGEVRYTWRCEVGHEFRSRTYEARREWCTQCVPSKAVEMTPHELAAFRWNGEVVNSQNNRWRCADGHTFEASLATAALVWCPKCRATTNQPNSASRRNKEARVPVGSKNCPAEITARH